MVRCLQVSYILQYHKISLYPRITEKCIDGKISVSTYGFTDELIDVLNISRKCIINDVGVYKEIVIGDSNKLLPNLKIIMRELIERIFLDVSVEDKSENTLFELEKFDEILHKNMTTYKITKTYDDVSSYYCKKLYPFLDKFDRLLRQLLYNTYIIKYGEGFSKKFNYKLKPGSTSLKARKKDESKDTGENDEINYFYAYDYTQLIDILFGENNADETAQWDLLFANKVSLGFTKEKIEKFKELRNNIAHCKLLTTSEYYEAYNFLVNYNSAFEKAVEYTYTIDFSKKLREDISDVFKEWDKELKKLFGKRMSKNE